MPGLAENWLPIPTLGGRYFASDHGSIKGPSGKVLRLKTHMHGYLVFGVADGQGGSRNVYVARAVCEAFHGAPSDGQQVDHIDHCRNNNRPENLRWVSKAENLAHRRPKRGVDNINAKITEDDVRAIRASTERREVIGAMFGLNPRHVTDIRNGTCWSHVR